MLKTVVLLFCIISSF